MNQVWGEMEDGVLEAAATLGLWTRASLLAWKFAGTGQRAANAWGEMTAGLGDDSARAQEKSWMNLCQSTRA